MFLNLSTFHDYQKIHLFSQTDSTDENLLKMNFYLFNTSSVSGFVKNVQKIVWHLKIKRVSVLILPGM